MPKKWIEVVRNPEYMNLSSEDKSRVKQEYFANVIKPNISARDIPAARQEFLKHTQTLKKEMEVPLFGFGAAGTILETPKEEAEYVYESALEGEKPEIDLVIKEKQREEIANKIRAMEPEQRKEFAKTLPPGVYEEILPHALEMEGIEETLTDPKEMAIGIALGTGLTSALRLPLRPLREAIATITAGTSEIPGLTRQVGKSVIRRLTKPTVKEGIENADIFTKAFGELDPEAKSVSLVKSYPVDEAEKYAASINLHRQRIPEELKAIEKKVGEKIPKFTQTWDETEELAKEIYSDYNAITRTFKKLGDVTKGLTAQFDAARQFNIDAVRGLQKTAQTNPENLPLQFARWKEQIFKPLSEASSEIGRALNIHKRSIALNRLGRAFSKMSKKLNPRQLQEFKNLDTNNPLEVMDFLERLPDPRFRDYFYEYWYNSILSGIPTHIVNIASNTAWMAFQAPHRALTAGVDRLISKFTGKQRDFFLKELAPMWAGMGKGFKKGKTGALEVIKTGRAIGYESKFTREIGKNVLGAFERSPNKFLRKVAPIISSPTRALRAMDVWANSIAFDAQLRALARREGLRKGVKGKELRLFENELLSKPSKEMIDEAQKFAKYATFMDEPGKITRGILAVRQAIPGGRLVIPFVNTIGNLTKRGLEMTPGIGVMLAKGQKPAEVVAKQIEGAIIAYFVMNKVNKGEIIGSLPEHPAKRKAAYRRGEKAWSIKNGDQWYSFRRIEPLNTPIAMIATAYDRIKNAPDDKTATEIFMDISKELASNLIDSSYLQGVQNLLDRYGRTKGMAKRFFASLTPFSGFWRSINRAYEKTMTGKTMLRENKDLVDSFAQVIPGLSYLGKPRLNVWGEEIELEGNVFRQWLPYKWATAKEDKTEKVLKDLGRYPRLPNRTLKIRGQEVTLPEDIYRNYAIKTGKDAKQRIDRLVNSAGFDKRPDIIKLKQINRIMTNARRRGRGMAIREYSYRGGKE